ncbi:MAG: helix-turn-helix transcriptional regulator [Oscillospiraceae bacterium]|nr:helix-turn-helix transcriptional regulator [Oscillospiraceae bacterium]
MQRSFPEILSALRHGAGISQRQAAGELGISQALLSHYENGAREPGLSFVCRVCDYYGVTADYILGRSEDPGRLSVDDTRAFLGRLRELLETAEKTLETIEGDEA